MFMMMPLILDKILSISIQFLISLYFSICRIFITLKTEPITIRVQICFSFVNRKLFLWHTAPWAPISAWLCFNRMRFLSTKLLRPLLICWFDGYCCGGDGWHHGDRDDDNITHIRLLVEQVTDTLIWIGWMVENEIRQKSN